VPTYSIMATSLQLQNVQTLNVVRWSIFNDNIKYFPIFTSQRSGQTEVSLRFTVDIENFFVYS